jgi:hypothetical protein
VCRFVEINADSKSLCASIATEKATEKIIAIRELITEND